MPFATHKASVEDSDQTARMRSLVRVLDGRRCCRYLFSGNGLHPVREDTCTLREWSTSCSV